MVNDPIDPTVKILEVTDSDSSIGEEVQLRRKAIKFLKEKYYEILNVYEQQENS